MSVRVFSLRILVEILHIVMCGSRVEVEVIFLDVLTVISLAVRQSEKSLFENRVTLVPQCEREAEALLVV
jgi:hypothetical protein